MSLDIHNIFEVIMLLCFGASWPFAVYKTWRTKTAVGKSFLFLWLVLIGYISGILNKVMNIPPGRFFPDPVVFLYLLNGIMVYADLYLSYRYRRREIEKPSPSLVGEGPIDA